MSTEAPLMKIALLLLLCWLPETCAHVSAFSHDDHCSHEKVPAFDFSDKLETTLCVKKTDARIAGFKIIVYAMKYEMSGNCDNPHVFTDSHLCDIIIRPPYILLPAKHRLDFSGPAIYGPSNSNQHIYSRTPKGCVVDQPKASPCPNFTLSGTYMDEHQQFQGTQNDELMNILVTPGNTEEANYNFYDMALLDHEVLNDETLVRNHMIQKLMPLVEHEFRRFNHYNVTEVPCLNGQCSYAMLEYVVDFAYVLKPPSSSVIASPGAPIRIPRDT